MGGVIVEIDDIGEVCLVCGLGVVETAVVGWEVYGAYWLVVFYSDIEIYVIECFFVCE